MNFESLQYLLPFKSKCRLDQLSKIKEEREAKLQSKNWAAYNEILQKLPHLPHVTCDFTQESVQIGLPNEMPASQKIQLEEALKGLIPWRKGPFNLFGLELDAEWRSNLKWERFSSHLVDTKDKMILDIGANNGYYMFKMASKSPAMVLGIDPTPHFYYQFSLLQHFAQSPCLHYELFEMRHLSCFSEIFDIIIYMGIIYHHPNPIEHLQWIIKALKPGGQLILETIGIPGDVPYALFPEDRYAKMRNIWFIPTLPALINWMKKANWGQIEVLDITPSSGHEQRLTSWCPPPRQSYNDFIDPHDSHKTIEGYPSPLRICLSAKKKSRSARQQYY